MKKCRKFQWCFKTLTYLKAQTGKLITTVASDQVKEFVNSQFKETMSQYGINQIINSPGHSSSQASVERSTGHWW